MSAFKKTAVSIAVAAASLFPALAFAGEKAEEGSASGGHGGELPLVFLFLAVMLLFARVGALAERAKQPAVLGELVMGLVLGALALVPVLHFLGAFKQNAFIVGIAEIGVILLLFRTGLESNVKEMSRVGLPAFLVAVIGVALPFAGGYFASQWLMPGLASNTYLFIGATLTATSVGITARVFQDLKFSAAKEAKIVLGAAVIDDILGLLILAIVAGIVSGGSVSAGAVAALSFKVLAFLVGSIALGHLLAPRFGALFSKVHTGHGMKMAIALLFCFAYAYGAAAIAGLAPIVGAFAAGLVLDPVHFRAFAAPHIVEKLKKWAGSVSNEETKKEMEETAHHEARAHVENYIESVGSFFIPVFFVYTGMQVNLSAFGDPKIVGIALAVTLVAVIGKVLAGLAAGKGADKKIVGCGMVPRGEVGLIFANVGKQLGVVNDQVFAVAVIMVILTTLVTPPVLGAMIRKGQAPAEPAPVTP